jgi:hypothetical protein
LVPTQSPEGLRIQNQRFDVTGSLTGHRQWNQGVSFFMIDCGSGLKRGRLAIGDEQKKRHCRWFLPYVARPANSKDRWHGHRKRFHSKLELRPGPMLSDIVAQLLILLIG